MLGVITIIPGPAVQYTFRNPQCIIHLFRRSWRENHGEIAGYFLLSDYSR